MSSPMKSDIAEIIDCAYHALRDDNAEFLADMMVMLKDMNTGIHSKTASDLLTLSKSYGLEACSTYLETIQTPLFDYNGAIEYALSHRLFNPILVMQEHGKKKFTDALADVLEVRLASRKISPRNALTLIDHFTPETLTLLMKNERLLEFDVIDEDMLNFLGVSTQSEVIKKEGHHLFEKIYHAYTMIGNTDRTLSLWRWVYAFGIRAEVSVVRLDSLMDEFIDKYISAHPKALQSLFYAYEKINATNFTLCCHFLRTATNVVKTHTLKRGMVRNLFEAISPDLSEEDISGLSYDKELADTIRLFTKSLAENEAHYISLFDGLFQAVSYPNRPRSAMIIEAISAELSTLNCSFDNLEKSCKSMMVEIEEAFTNIISGYNEYHQGMYDTAKALLPLCEQHLQSITFEKFSVDSWKAYYLKVLPQLSTDGLNYLTLIYLDSISLSDALAEDMSHDRFTLAHLSRRFSLSEMIAATQSEAVREMLRETLTR